MDQRTLAATQGAYFLSTGVWPLLHMRSFVAVTGPKQDLWLVQTVGLLVSCIGAQLLMASRSDRVSPEIKTLAVSSALSLAAIDTVHSLRGRIRPVYLLDAVAEVALAALWMRSDSTK